MCLRRVTLHLSAFVVLSANAAVSALPPPDNPRELGDVHWGRNLEQALSQSKDTGKPVLLLFQEIPGCEGCVKFGDQPLSHPLLVEAMEDLFVPIAIHNNKPGYDKQVLDRFSEPAWNFPVMRFVNADGGDIIARQDSLFSTYDVSKRMIEALVTSEREVPEYLKIAMLEGDTRREHRERLTFAMHCFWEGEGRLGGIAGVVATRAAFYQRREVVDVLFDPTIVSIEELLAAADAAGCAQMVYVHGDDSLAKARKVLGERVQPARERTSAAPAADQLHTLAASPMRLLPLTPMQATKVNAALYADEDATRVLSPRQIALLAQVENALASRPGVLNGLVRPTEVAALPKYAQQLEARLNRVSTLPQR